MGDYFYTKQFLHSEWISTFHIYKFNRMTRSTPRAISKNFHCPCLKLAQSSLTLGLLQVSVYRQRVRCASHVQARPDVAESLGRSGSQYPHGVCRRKCCLSQVPGPGLPDRLPSGCLQAARQHTGKNTIFSRLPGNLTSIPSTIFLSSCKLDHLLFPSWSP